MEFIKGRKYKSKPHDPQYRIYKGIWENPKNLQIHIWDRYHCSDDSYLGSFMEEQIPTSIVMYDSLKIYTEYMAWISDDNGEPYLVGPFGFEQAIINLYSNSKCRILQIVPVSYTLKS